jgi:glycerol dehydrogenase
LQALPQPVGLAAETNLLRIFRKALSEAWLENGVELVLLNLPDGVECCLASAEALQKQAKAKGCASLLGLGGGKVLDTVKWASLLGGWPLATAPTSAATCAAASGVIAQHGPDGVYAGVLDLALPAQLCIVDTDVLAEAPPRLLAAGMADTLAKWLEWKALPQEAKAFGHGAGWLLAERGALACESLGPEALRETGSAAWETCVEACLLWSAQASCLGQAPAAAAHSLANALTRQPAGRSLMHGEQVGLGLLWQEALLSKTDPVWGFERVRKALYGWGLPASLPSGLDLDRLAADALREDETVHALGLDLDPVRARDAFASLSA